MALILSKKYVGKNSYRRFVKNRVLKIYPLYLFVLVLSLFFSLFWMSLGLSSPIEALQYDLSTLHPLTIYYLILENVFIITSDLGSFLSVDSKGLLQFTPHTSTPFPFIYLHSLIPQAWTLSIEFVFYAIAPFLVKRKLWILILFAIGSLLLRLFIYSLGFHHEPWINKFPPTELIFFLLGVFSYRIFNSKKLEVLNQKIFLIIYLGFILLTITYDFIPKILNLPINPIQWGYFLILASLIPFVFRHFKDNSIDRFLGDLSYPIYISHVLIIFMVSNAKIFFDPNIRGIMSIALTILFSISLLWLSQRYIEKFRK